MGRRHRLTIDALEGRSLLSLTPLIGSPSWSQHAPSPAGIATARATSSGTLTVDPVTGIVSNDNLGGSGITSDVAPPRPIEARARAFSAKFAGRVQELPPRLLDQSRQFAIVAPGTTSQFLHGTLQLRYYTPNPDPIAIPDPDNPGSTIVERVKVTTGTLSMADRSTQSGGVILANLTGSPADVDARGRPTHFDLALNGGGGSGGIYASATGSGTVDIAYKGNNVTVKVRATFFLQGIGNPLMIYQTSHR